MKERERAEESGMASGNTMDVECGRWILSGVEGTADQAGTGRTGRRTRSVRGSPARKVGKDRTEWHAGQRRAGRRPQT